MGTRHVEFGMPKSLTRLDTCGNGVFRMLARLDNNAFILPDTGDPAQELRRDSLGSPGGLAVRRGFGGGNRDYQAGLTGIGAGGGSAQTQRESDHIRPASRRQPAVHQNMFTHLYAVPVVQAMNRDASRIHHESVLTLQILDHGVMRRGDHPAVIAADKPALDGHVVAR